MNTYQFQPPHPENISRIPVEQLNVPEREEEIIRLIKSTLLNGGSIMLYATNDSSSETIGTELKTIVHPSHFKGMINCHLDFLHTIGFRIENADN